MAKALHKWMVIVGISLCALQNTESIEAGNTSSAPQKAKNTTGVQVNGKDSSCAVFPYYSRGLSEELRISEVEGVVHLDEPGYLLTTMSDCLHGLGKIARTDMGESIDFHQINERTIFINRMVSAEIKQYLPKRDRNGNAQLGELCELADRLGIKALGNAFAYHIAERIYPIKGTVEGALKTRGFGELSEKSLKRVRKYVYFKKEKIQEETIADYIGLYGQPPEDENEDLFVTGILMNFKKITGLDGIQFIQKVKQDKNAHLRLDRNYIIGSDLDPDMPTLDRLHLYILDLSHNDIKELPDFFFTGVLGPKKVDLRHNLLKPFPLESRSWSFEVAFHPQSELGAQG